MSTHQAVALAVARVFALAVLAGGVSAILAVAYRWWSGQRVPDGVAILVGVTAVALLLNTEQTLRQVITDGDAMDSWRAARTVGTFAVSTVGADLGRRVGDRTAERVLGGSRFRIDREFAQVVRAAGRVVSVTLPESIDDIDGYDPVPEATKTAVAGSTFVFPRRVTVGELEDRIRHRLEDDYGVGHVDVDVTADGEVTYLAVGAREAGLGPTLAPGTVAVAVQADPANGASAGDVVQVWARESSDGSAGAADAGSTADYPASMRRVVTAEVRATAEDVVTLAVDETEVDRLADDVRYRLVTLPIDERAGREFASLLRAAAETMSVVPVSEGSALTGVSVGGLAVTVAAIRAPDGTVTPIPHQETPIEAGSQLYVIGRPDAIRAFEGAQSTALEREDSGASSD